MKVVSRAGSAEVSRYTSLRKKEFNYFQFLFFNFISYLDFFHLVIYNHEVAHMRYEQFAYFFSLNFYTYEIRNQFFSYQRSENKEADEVGGQVPVGVAKSGSKKPLIKRTKCFNIINVYCKKPQGEEIEIIYFVHMNR